jgi:protocatechuate 3,4-dioxygenase beta subunit
MKNIITFLCSFCFIVSYTLSAQEDFADVSEVPTHVLEASASILSEIVPTDYKKRSPIYDYSEQNLNNIDTIPGFETKQNKLKITGTIFKNDGITPAKDVILFINQTDENGNFELKIDNHKKRYVYHRAWIKTNADGQYTFYTFVPGTIHRSNELKHIHPVIKENGKEEQDLYAFVFDNDPLLTKRCRSKLANNILKLEKKEDMYVTTKDIILDQKGLLYK